MQQPLGSKNVQIMHMNQTTNSMKTSMSTCIVGPTGRPRQERKQEVAHVLDGYRCSMEIFNETSYLNGPATPTPRTVLRKFVLRIVDENSSTSCSWLCKKNGSSLLFTPFYCTGTFLAPEGRQDIITRNFSWVKGMRTEQVCMDFIHFLY